MWPLRLFHWLYQIFKKLNEYALASLFITPRRYTFSLFENWTIKIQNFISSLFAMWYFYFTYLLVDFLENLHNVNDWWLALQNLIFRSISGIVFTSFFHCCFWCYLELKESFDYRQIIFERVKCGIFNKKTISDGILPSCCLTKRIVNKCF